MSTGELTPAERSLIARVASHKSWANTDDRTARTAPGRDAMWEKFLRQADPDGVLAPEVRRQKAASLRKAFYADMARKSVQARRIRAGMKKPTSKSSGRAAGTARPPDTPER